MKQKLVLVIALGLSVQMTCNGSSAWAEATEGTGTRGGGNARVCFTTTQAAQAAKRYPKKREGYWNAIESIEVLDLYEAKLPRGADGVSPSIVNTKPGENGPAYAERIAKRFDRKLGSFANIIRSGAKTFSQMQIIWSEEPLGRTDDINSAIPLEGAKCAILALAYQKEVNGSEKLFIDRPLFQHPKHPQLSRNVTFLHEYVLAHVRQNSDHETSAPTREAVGLAISKLPEGVDASQAESMGLSIAQIMKSLEASGVLSWDSSSVGVLQRPHLLEEYREILRPDQEIKEYRAALARLPRAIQFRDEISRIVLDEGKYSPGFISKYLDSTIGLCRRDGGESKPSSLNEIILASCFVITSYASEFVSDPALIQRLRAVGEEIKRFLIHEAPPIMRENVMPRIFEKTTARLTQHFSIEMTSRYQELLASFLIDSFRFGTDETDSSWILSYKFLECYSGKGNELEKLVEEELKSPADTVE